MKHVFIVNSHTTYLSSVGSIRYQNLQISDIVIISVRNYKNEILKIGCKWLDCNALYLSFETEKASMLRKAIRETDTLIRNNISEKYTLYVPHLAHHFFQAMSTNLMCSSISYVQEGGINFKATYITNISKLRQLYNKITNFLHFGTQRVFRSTWYKEGWVHNKKMLKSYSTNKDFFRYLPAENHIIKWPKVKLDIKIDTDALFFVFDGYVKNHVVEKEIYYAVTSKLIRNYAKNNNYIKFHPAQSEEERNYLIEQFGRNNKSCEVLPDNIPFEFYLSSFNKLSIVGFGSSLLYFAHDMGHDVVSHDDWLLESKLFNDYLNMAGVGIYKDNVSVH